MGSRPYRNVPLREYMKGNTNGYGESSCSIPGHRIQESINFESLYDYKSAKFYDTSLNNFKKSYKWNSINESELTIQNNTRINRYNRFLGLQKNLYVKVIHK